MRTSKRVTLTIAAPVVAALGLLAAGATLSLPWRELDFRLAPALRVVMALAGAAILVLAARTTWSRSTGPTPPDGLLGALAALLGLVVLTYPTTLSLAAAGVAGRPVQVLAAAGHIVPLVLVQLLPVLAAQAVTRRSRRGWTLVIIAVAVVSVLLSAPTLLGGRGSVVMAAVGTTLWLGSFALAPVATWTVVAGTSGETRRRAIVAGLASVVPVVVIALCVTLGAAAETRGLSTDASVAALMGGFSLGTFGSALLVEAATGPEESVLLRHGAVVALLQGLLVAAAVLLASGTALVAQQSGLGSAATVVLGIGVVVVVGLGAVRLFGWAARAADPAAEFRHELAALGEIPDGEQRLSLQQALRRVLGDAGLVLVVRAPDGVWVDAAGRTADGPPAGALRVAGPALNPSAVVAPGQFRTPSRLARLGDIAPLLRPAVLEATVLRETTRADAAARAERDRLSQDLHDGLQGKLLGIALNLQLSGQEVEDPAARLLVEETVASLRDAVDDVRALADGRLPMILVDGGLRPALADLVRPLAAVVDLDVSDVRLAPDLEATGYFVVGEAVSNAIKHGHADHVQVRVETSAGLLRIMVVDDGVGGADPRLGSGLRGLAERVSASGGVLVVRSADPSGTVVEASMPCGS